MKTTRSTGSTPIGLPEPKGQTSQTDSLKKTPPKSLVRQNASKDLKNLKKPGSSSPTSGGNSIKNFIKRNLANSNFSVGSSPKSLNAPVKKNFFSSTSTEVQALGSSPSSSPVSSRASSPSPSPSHRDLEAPPPMRKMTTDPYKQEQQAVEQQELEQQAHNEMLQHNSPYLAKTLSTIKEGVNEDQDE